MTRAPAERFWQVLIFCATSLLSFQSFFVDVQEAMMPDSPKPDMNPMEAGPMPADFQGGPPPDGAESARPYPGGIMQIEPPKVKGWPYVRRSLKLLGNHKGIVAATMFLTLVMNLAPFVVAAAFGPMVQILGEAARGDRLGNRRHAS